jgi:2-methylcitrate dehydratase PrpD
VSAEAPDGYRDALLDWMACAVAGMSEPTARAALEAGDGLLDRVAAAGTAGHLLDFDDTYLPGVAHLSAPTAPVALVLGAGCRANVGEALAAYAAGFEATGALARASHPALYEGGWHPTAVCGSLGAAVTASRLLDLDEEAERSASALALLRAAGLRSAFGSPGKSLQVGLAAAAGVAAARLAAAGVKVSLEQVALAAAGFEQAFGARFEPAGDPPAIAENWIKAYPCCLQTHGAIEAALAARSELGADARVGAWPTIEVSVHPLSLQAASVNDPRDGLEAKFSIPYLTAFALLHGAPRRESFDDTEPAARRLGAEVSVRADDELLESAARLSLDGSQVAEVQAATGSPQRPLGDKELAAKRRSLAGERLEGALEDPRRPASELLELLAT